MFQLSKSIKALCVFAGLMTSSSASASEVFAAIALGITEQPIIATPTNYSGLGLEVKRTLDARNQVAFALSPYWFFLGPEVTREEYNNDFALRAFSQTELSLAYRKDGNDQAIAFASSFTLSDERDPYLDQSLIAQKCVQENLMGTWGEKPGETFQKHDSCADLIDALQANPTSLSLHIALIADTLKAPELQAFRYSQTAMSLTYSHSLGREVPSDEDVHEDPQIDLDDVKPAWAAAVAQLAITAHRERDGIDIALGVGLRKAGKSYVLLAEANWLPYLTGNPDDVYLAVAAQRAGRRINAIDALSRYQVGLNAQFRFAGQFTAIARTGYLFGPYSAGDNASDLYVDFGLRADWEKVEEKK